ncbi:sugar ABC transporter substrate-binding protein [Marispirochaeta aestuarii]|jgi:simple sugar transport system substrate-binding protein|uniref:Sugar ABC transporter substrate-binding protein n=1 Tax=Marispirochaeta aestuarii TaxID=1963862 RepID=A0A1Y1RYH3_9SPIO|nr:substrate-binding domain-containing protein [Marispirochaeta aestuarii]ORC34852.1 sugar ABC transporter substrate-binding protein [Marispirochaeta aestuarii]
MKKLSIFCIFALLLIIMLSPVMVFAGGSKDTDSAGDLIRVGIVNLPPEESGYRQANVEDMNNVFSRANGYDAKQTNTGDNSEQIAAAKGYIRDGVDYLLISAANASGWDDTLKSAKDAGIKVILFDRAIDTEKSNYQAALLSDMAYEGDTAVAWVLGLKLDKINLILIRGQMGSAAEIGRSGAVLKAEKEGKLNIVADGTGGDSWSLEEARKVVEAAIAAGKDFNVIYAENDGMAQGAVQALEAAGISHGKGGKVKIIGFDFNRFALRNVQAGYWDADMQCNPRQAAEISKWIKSGNLPDGIVYQEELLLTTDTITDKDIEKWGINADPGKGVITR